MHNVQLLQCVYTLQFVFSPLDLGGQSGQQGDVILRQSIPAGEVMGEGQDLGETLVGQWDARVALLELTLELQEYLDGNLEERL